MTSHSDTSWSLVEAAAQGSETHRSGFVARYEPLVRAYLESRWRRSLLREGVADGVQEVFLECFRHGGALGKADRERPGGFRAFLYGVVRNVALRAEERCARRAPPQGETDAFGGVMADDTALSQAFDRAYIRSLVLEASKLHESRSRQQGPEASRRRELLRLHAADGRQIKDIAREWNIPESTLYKQHLLAKQEFKATLLEVLAFHHPGTPDELELEWSRLQAILG